MWKRFARKVMIPLEKKIACSCSSYRSHSRGNKRQMWGSGFPALAVDLVAAPGVVDQNRNGLMRTTDVDASAARFRLYLFQSPGTDLYALSETKSAASLPCTGGFPSWRLSHEVIASSLLTGSDAVGLKRLMAQVRRHGHLVFRADQVSVH